MIREQVSFIIITIIFYINFVWSYKVIFQSKRWCDARNFSFILFYFILDPFKETNAVGPY